MEQTTLCAECIPCVCVQLCLHPHQSVLIPLGHRSCCGPWLDALLETMAITTMTKTVIGPRLGSKVTRMLAGTREIIVHRLEMHQHANHILRAQAALFTLYNRQRNNASHVSSNIKNERHCGATRGDRMCISITTHPATVVDNTPRVLHCCYFFVKTKSKTTTKSEKNTLLPCLPFTPVRTRQLGGLCLYGAPPCVPHDILPCRTNRPTGACSPPHTSQLGQHVTQPSDGQQPPALSFLSLLLPHSATQQHRYAHAGTHTQRHKKFAWSTPPLVQGTHHLSFDHPSTSTLGRCLCQCLCVASVADGTSSGTGLCTCPTSSHGVAL